MQLNSTPQRKSLLVNGERTETEAHTLAELIATLDLDGDTVATALNGEFVARGARAATLLSDGDKVEIVAPRQGG
jgi:sulfur carrier protein